MFFSNFSKKQNPPVRPLRNEEGENRSDNFDDEDDENSDDEEIDIELSSRSGGNNRHHDGESQKEERQINIGFNSLIGKFADLRSNLGKVVTNYNDVIYNNIMKDNRFNDWTREELVDRLIFDGVEIRNEEFVDIMDLRRFLDDLYEGQKIPRRLEPLSMRQLFIIERAVLFLQDRWIYLRFRAIKRKEQQRAYLYDMPYMYEEEFYDGLLFDSRDYEAMDNRDIESLYGEDMYSRSDNAYTGWSEADEEFKYENPYARLDSRQNNIPPHTFPTHSNKFNLKPISEKFKHVEKKTLKILEIPWKPPDWSVAQRAQDYVHPRRGGRGGTKYDYFKTTTGRHCYLGGCGEQCDLWEEGRISEFSIYGAGVTNYFKFLKWLFWLFGTLSVIALPVLLINKWGGASGSAPGLKSFSTFSAGNLEGTYINSTLYVQVGICDVLEDPIQQICPPLELSQMQISYIYACTDVLITFVVVLAYIWLVNFQHSENFNLEDSILTASQFAIQIKNLPPSVTEAELKQHLFRLLDCDIPIVDIDFSYDNSSDIELCRKRGELVRAKSRLVHQYRYRLYCLQGRVDLDKLSKRDAINRIEKEFKHFYDSCKELDFDIKDIDKKLTKHDELPDIPRIAYVTFNESLGASIILDLYQNSLLNLCFPRKQRLMLHGHLLAVEPAPEPSTIIWENLHISRLQRILRLSLTTILAACFIVASVAIVIGARYLTNSYVSGGSDPCSEQFYKLSSTEKQTWVQNNPGQLHCYCDELTANEQSSNSQCASYLREETFSQLLTFGSSLVIVIVNVLIGYVMRAFANFERHRSTNEQEQSIFLRVFILKYINSSLIFLVSSNLSLNDLNSDFTLSWYQSSGATLIAVQLFNIIFGHAEALIQDALFRHRLKLAKRDPSIALTQAELNKMHTGPTFTLAVRYAQLLSTYLVCMTFCTGMPLLYPVVALNFFVFYLADKLFFVRLYRIPQRFDEALQRQATFIIPIGVVIHLVMSIWTLSITSIFPDELSHQAVTIDLGNKPFIAYNQTFPLFLVLVCVTSLFLFQFGVMTLLRVVTGLQLLLQGDVERKKRINLQLTQRHVRQKVSGGFVRALQRNLIKDLASYNILRNPLYNDAFALPSIFTLKHKRVRSIYKLVSNPRKRAADASDGDSTTLFDDGAGGDAVQEELLRRQAPALVKLRQFENAANKSKSIQDKSKRPTSEIVSGKDRRPVSAIYKRPKSSQILFNTTLPGYRPQANTPGSSEVGGADGWRHSNSEHIYPDAPGNWPSNEFSWRNGFPINRHDSGGPRYVDQNGNIISYSSRSHRQEDSRDFDRHYNMNRDGQELFWEENYPRESDRRAGYQQQRSPRDFGPGSEHSFGFPSSWDQARQYQYYGNTQQPYSSQKSWEDMEYRESFSRHPQRQQTWKWQAWERPFDPISTSANGPPGTYSPYYLPDSPLSNYGPHGPPSSPPRRQVPYRSPLPQPPSSNYYPLSQPYNSPHSPIQFANSSSFQSSYGSNPLYPHADQQPSYGFGQGPIGPPPWARRGF